MYISAIFCVHSSLSRPERRHILVVKLGITDSVRTRNVMLSLHVFELIKQGLFSLTDNLTLQMNLSVSVSVYLLLLSIYSETHLRVLLHLSLLVLE